MLAAAFAAAGAVVERLEPVADDADAHRRALERGLRGRRARQLRRRLGRAARPRPRACSAELGVEEVFWGVAVKPGKPLAFGVRDRTLVFGLPGNPVSSLVSVELFVRPALAALQGARAGPALRARRVLAAPLRRNAARDELVRAPYARDGDETVVEPLSGQESHMIARAAAADALVHVPRGEGELAAGARVRILPLWR